MTLMKQYKDYLVSHLSQYKLLVPVFVLAHIFKKRVYSIDESSTNIVEDLFSVPLGEQSFFYINEKRI